MARRLLFVCLLVLLEVLPTVATLSVLVTLQVVYMGILIIIRPFQELKATLIELINECFFLGLA